MKEETFEVSYSRIGPHAVAKDHRNRPTAGLNCLIWL